MKKMIEILKRKYQVSDVVFKRENLTFATVDKDNAVDLITYLKRVENYTHLVLLTAVDWLEDEKFQLTYLLNSPENMTDIGVRVLIDRENATMESTHHLWATASTYQREIKEMFGIDFPGSPGVDEPFILEGWEDLPPYRRDFDTKKYSEDTYFPRPGRKTHDPGEYMKNKLYPEDGGKNNV